MSQLFLKYWLKTLCAHCTVYVWPWKFTKFSLIFRKINLELFRHFTFHDGLVATKTESFLMGQSHEPCVRTKTMCTHWDTYCTYTYVHTLTLTLTIFPYQLQMYVLNYVQYLIYIADSVRHKNKHFTFYLTNTLFKVYMFKMINFLVYIII